MANWGACEVIEHHQEIETNPTHYATKGAVMQEAGNYEEAERAFLSAIKYEANDKQKNQYTTSLLSMYYQSGRNDLRKKADRLYDGWWEKRKQELLAYKGVIWILLGFLLIAMGGVGNTTDAAVPLFILPLIIGAFYILNVKRIETVSLKKGAGKLVASILIWVLLSFVATFGWVVLLSAIAQMLHIPELPYMVTDSTNFGAMLIGILTCGIGVETVIRSIQFDFHILKEGKAKRCLNCVFTIARIAVIIGTIIALINMVGYFGETITYHSRSIPNMVDRDGYFD